MQHQRRWGAQPKNMMSVQTWRLILQIAKVGEWNLQGRQRGSWFAIYPLSVNWSGAHTGMGISAFSQVEGSISGPVISAWITSSRSESGINWTSDIAPMFLQASPFLWPSLCSGVFRETIFRPSPSASVLESCFVWPVKHASSWIAPACAIIPLIRSWPWPKPSVWSKGGRSRIGWSTPSSTEYIWGAGTSVCL